MHGPLDNLGSNSEHEHLILIFEDVEEMLRYSDQELQYRLTNFLWSSRHRNISILYIMHDCKGVNSQKVSFTRSFLSNCTAVVAFQPTGHDRVCVYRYLKNMIAHSSSKTDEILDKMFKVACSCSKWPYLFIQCRKDVDSYLKIRTDIYNKHGLIFDKLG